jgi:hypothetical protein
VAAMVVTVMVMVMVMMVDAVHPYIHLGGWS